MQQRYNNNYDGGCGAITIWMTGKELRTMLDYGKELFYSSEDATVYVANKERDSDDVRVANAQDLVENVFSNYPEWGEEDELVTTVRLPSYEYYL
jgi:hypothetical protein